MANHSAAAFWYGQCSVKAKEKTLENVGRRLSKRFQTYKDALMDAAGLKNASPAERLAAYQARTPQTWRLLEKVWPEEKAKQSKDWQDLETTSLNKRMVAQLTRDRIPAGVKA